MNMMMSMKALAVALAVVARANGDVKTVTAYCPCQTCCGKWSGGPTASGRKPEAGVTCAAPRNIPFGTWLNIEGVGVRRVDDRLASKYDSRVDVFFDKHEDALRFGKQQLKVEVLR